MKAVFVLFVIVAIIGMAMAGVHHYRVGGAPPAPAAPAPAPVPDSAHHAGLFAGIASDINGLFG